MYEQEIISQGHQEAPSLEIATSDHPKPASFFPSSPAAIKKPASQDSSVSETPSNPNDEEMVGVMLTHEILC